MHLLTCLQTLANYLPTGSKFLKKCEENQKWRLLTFKVKVLLSHQSQYISKGLTFTLKANDLELLVRTAIFTVSLACECLQTSQRLSLKL